MNARQLEIFHAVMRGGTITGAAAFLGISQPAVSKAIQQAERKVGFRLFRSIRGRLYPTPEAERLLPEAERIINDMSAFRRLAGEVRTGGTGLVRVAASSGCAATLLPRATAAFRKKHPTVRLSTHLLPAREVAEAVAASEVEFGLALSRVEVPGLTVRSLGASEMIFIAPLGHRLLEQEVVTPVDIEGEPLVSFGSDTHFGQLLDRAFDSVGIRRETTLQVGLVGFAIPYVQQGLGVAVVNDMATELGMQGIGWRPFKPTILLPLMLLTDVTQPLSRHSAAFISAVETALNEAPIPR